MNLWDKNETLQSPEGYEIVALSAEGSYLRVEYRRELKRTSKRVVTSTVVVFLNDFGREVARTEDTAEEKFPEPHVVVPLTTAMRLKNGLYLILAGINEVISCRKKW